MRRRFQNGSLIKKRGKGKSWEAQWREDGRKRKRVLGRRSEMTKSEALNELAKIVAPLNSRESPPSKAWALADFMTSVFLPFYRRKWKRSTAMTNEDRMNYHLVS